jgi:hypothetical protein
MPHPFDLSNLSKLREVEFRWNTPDIQFLTASLQTVKSPNLRRISITIGQFVPFLARVGRAVHREWLDLDRMLAQWWTSRSILPKIRYEWKGDFASRLLPELTSRGAVSAVR